MDDDLTFEQLIGGLSVEKLTEGISDELAGKLAKKAMSSDVNLLEIQDQLRRAVERFIDRNAIFTAKVQAENRVTIPSADVENLDIEQGDLVKVILLPHESVVENEEDD